MWLNSGSHSFCIYAHYIVMKVHFNKMKVSLNCLFIFFKCCCLENNTWQQISPIFFSKLQCQWQRLYISAMKPETQPLLYTSLHMYILCRILAMFVNRTQVLCHSNWEGQNSCLTYKSRWLFWKVFTADESEKHIDKRLSLQYNSEIRLRMLYH